ncbi:MAG TPA: hypothetical protein VFA23_04450, partial [Dongiaceae bacterium]|nr:hypothetical protein [Dongiaceae bacterium]
MTPVDRAIENAEGAPILGFLREQFARVNQRFDVIERRLDEVVSRLGILEREVSSLESRVA